MANSTFSIARTKATQRHAKTVDATEIAARYFIYELYEATGGYPMQWAALYGIDESAATICRAVERGWVVLQGVGRKPLDRKAALTDDGLAIQRLASHALKNDPSPLNRSGDGRR